MATLLLRRTPTCEEPLPVTLGELIAVLSDLTDDEDEIVATVIHMVSGRRVRLVERFEPS